MPQHSFNPFVLPLRVSPEYFERHHNRILHNFGIVLKMEHMYGGIIATGRHKWVLMMEVNSSQGFLVELHGLVRLGGQVDVVAD